MNHKLDNLLGHYCDELNYNPVKTTIHTLKDLYDMKIHPQVFHGTLGLTAKKYHSIEGINVGALLFLGIYLVKKGFTDEETQKACEEFSGILRENESAKKCEIFDSVLEDKNGMKCIIRNTIDLLQRFIDHLEQEMEDVDCRKASMI
ncbi:MAG: hypothetical protein Q4P28_04125 [Tissierellia bacterium]|nr:hypothetical protein [Tissierellia bacterium]